jgi:hypothetical protein
VSRTQGFVTNPFGSAGNLCLGGAIGRYVAPGQIKNSGPDGLITLGLDLGNVPQPSGHVGIQPGESWSFQLWHRENFGGAGNSNYTDGYEIVFE